MTIQHLDEQESPCARHPTATIEELMFLAIVGSRAPGFHHDVASKLQGLAMSLDEISELSQNDPRLTRAAETALDSFGAVLALLNANRALTKPPTRTSVSFREILARAAERVYVSLAGELVDATIEVSAPATIHALSLVFDLAARPGPGRTLPATAKINGTHIELRLGCSPSPPSNSGESLALATFVLGRDRGSLRCTESGTHLIVRLPLVAA